MRQAREAMNALIQSCCYANTFKTVMQMLEQCQEKVSLSVSVRFKTVAELPQFKVPETFSFLELS